MAYKGYKNVCKTAAILGLSSELFWIFLGVSSIVGFVMAITGNWIIISIGAVLLGALYGITFFLLETYGVHFFKKLISYYTSQSFKVVRKNRDIKKLLQK